MSNTNDESSAVRALSAKQFSQNEISQKINLSSNCKQDFAINVIPKTHWVGSILPPPSAPSALEYLHNIHLVVTQLSVSASLLVDTFDYSNIVEYDGPVILTCCCASNTRSVELPYSRSASLFIAQRPKQSILEYHRVTYIRLHTRKQTKIPIQSFHPLLSQLSISFLL